MSNAPWIIRDTAAGALRLSLEDAQFARREVELAGGIDRAQAMNTIRALRQLAEDDPDRPITLLINSGGGAVVDGLAIYDVMRALPCPVNTVCVGEASSMASLLFAAGARRSMLPSATVMIHDPLIGGSGVTGSALSVEAMTSRLMLIRQQIAKILARHTGHSVEEVLDKTARDTYFDAEEAVRWGLADEILTAWGGIANA